MATPRKSLKFTKRRFTNPYKSLATRFEKSAEKLPELEAVFTWRAARSSMKKAPKKPKTIYGRQRQYGKGTNAYKSGKRNWYQKGLYSRPGKPPHWHAHEQKSFDVKYGNRKKSTSTQFNLRFITFHRIMNPTIPVGARRGPGSATFAWRVGPEYKSGRHRIPVPQLHEYGGKRKVSKRRGTITQKGLTIYTTGTGNRYYPARPYMRPAAKEARTSAAKKSPHTIKKLTQLGGMKGRRKYYREAKVRGSA